MENKYDNLLLANKFRVMAEQFVLENNVTIDSNEEVVKILSVNSNVNLDYPIEVLKGEANLSGKVILNIVYITENGDMNNHFCTSPFVYKLNNQNFDSSCKLNVNVKVVSTDLDKVMGNQLKIVTTLNVDGVCIKNVEKNYIKETDEFVYSKQVEQDIVSLNSQGCDKFEESLEVTIKDGLKKVLMTNVDCVIKDWYTGTNFICVEGDVYVKILYANKNEISELQTISVSKSFKQEFECEGVGKDIDLDIFSSVLYDQIMIELEEKENGETLIKVNTPIVICYNTFKTEKILSIVDAYSTVDVISLQSEDLTNYKNCSPEFVDAKIEGNVVLSDNEPRVDKYLSTTNVCTNISNCYVINGNLNIEGIVSANIVYLNDELEAIQSVEIEIPFVVNKKVDLPEDVILQPIICLYDVDVMVKRGREIYFDAKIKAFINVSCKTQISMVTKLDYLEKLPNKDNAVEIYFAKSGDYIWDIAKDLKIPTEVILTQNPNLLDPLDKDENITIYYQKKRNNQKLNKN